MNDKIKPDYYGKLDVISFCTENNIPFCEGNIIKYVVRYSKKNGIEDLKKAQEYLQRLIDSIEKKENTLIYSDHPIGDPVKIPSFCVVDKENSVKLAVKPLRINDLEIEDLPSYFKMQLKRKETEND